MAKRKKLPTAEARRISVLAECDPRTVQRYVAGDSVQPMVAARIEAAMKAGTAIPLRP